MDQKILLIEDNNDVRETTAAILELARYQVITATNGREGVDLAMKEKPDLIICDIMMPVLDGYGVLHLLSKNRETAGIPFIFLSAKAERSDQRKGMDMGADDYIAKPFDDIELLSAIESRLKRSEVIRKEYIPTRDGLSDFLHDARELNDLRQLSEQYSVTMARKKDAIYKEGSMPRGLYFLCSGKVKTSLSNEQGKELITGLYKEGDFFGYLSLLEGEKYRDSATALEDSEICMIPKDDFFSLIYTNPQVSQKFIRIMSNNLLDREEQLIRLAYNSVRKRVAEALIKLCDHYGSDAGRIDMTISREDLANLAGTATETTIRTLSDFRQEGLVDIKSGTISILEYARLSGIKN